MAVTASGHGRIFTIIPIKRNVTMIFEIGVPNALWVCLTLTIGAIAALLLGWMRGQKSGMSPKRLILCTALLPVLTAFFSHLCYCRVCVTEVAYSQTIGYWFAFWQSGQMMYGGILGAVIALAIAGGKERFRLMDAYAPSAALMIAFARVAEGFHGQGYGEYWYEKPGFFCRFPFMAYDPYYESWAWSLFMAGAVIALVLFAVLITRRPAFAGDHMLTLLGLYASAQVVLESLRRDEFLRWGFVRAEELLSAVVILAVLILYWVRSGKARSVSKAVCTALFVTMVVFCLLLEFATEGRIPFLVFLDVWHCYALMAAACAVNAACVLWMRRLSIRR